MSRALHRPSSLRPALRRLADRVLEMTDLDRVARLLTDELPAALNLPDSSLLLWDRKLEGFRAFPETKTAALPVPRSAPTQPPDARWLISDGLLLETRGGTPDAVLVPLTARSGLVGMLTLSVPPLRRRKPLRTAEAQMLWTLARRAALAVENDLYLAELVASERMAALGTMTGMLAHDFRGPMTVIRGHAEMLSQETANPDKVREHAASIVRMVDRLDRMTSETLDFGRGAGRLARRAHRLTTLLEELCAAIEEELPGLTIVREFRISPDAVAELDADKLRRALGNMAANARDAMGGRGRLHLTVDLQQSGGEDRIVLLVADEGPGVPSEIRDRIFEPFVTRGKKSGTGLGLAVARRFVEEHGGTIELVEGASGARFRVTLPARERAPGVEWPEGRMGPRERP
jgi:signal transduction histidine kinase